VITVVPSSSTKKSLEEATHAYELQLEGSPGSQYLLSRGITSEVAASFRLGFVGEPLPGDDHLRNRISIPYLTPAGVVGLQLRATAVEAEKKYLPWRSGLPGRPFNVSALLQGGAVYLTEGEIDAISATLAGLPAVGISGAKKWKPVYARMFRFREVVILADAGSAGSEFAEACVRDLEGAKIIYMPGDDVNYNLCRLGIEGLRKLVLDE